MPRTETIGDNGKRLGERIRKCRQDARMSMSELAARVGVTEGTIRFAEVGPTKVPSAIIVLRIARELNVDPYALVFGDPSELRRARNAATPAEPRLSDAETFGARLQRLRRTRGLSHSRLGLAAGVTEGAIRQMESGQTKWAALPVAIRLAHALGVEPRDLAFGRGDGTQFAADALPVPESRMDSIEGTVAALAQRVAALERRS